MNMTGHPEIDAILDRVQRYRDEVYARDGVPPETFLVTEREYALLQTYRAPSWVAVNVDTLSDTTPRPISLFGMRVVQPERFEWARESTRANPRPSSLTLAELERAFAPVLEQSSGTHAADPLPPLDDLDEGLQCCGRRYPTFAAFLAHRRGHEEMR
jgi:hypothetical protein